MLRRTVEVNHRIWIAAPVDTVRSQFADLQHHIDANVHPKLKFEVLAQEPGRARFTQEVTLLGMRQKDLMERTVDDDGSIHDRSIEGFNKGATLDFRFEPQAEGGRSGTSVDITIRLQTPPLLGWLAPVLHRQALKETVEAARQDKCDIEAGYRPRH
jgi:hypothetical protein